MIHAIHFKLHFLFNPTFQHSSSYYSSYTDSLFLFPPPMVLPSSSFRSQSLVHLRPPLIPCWEDCNPCTQHCFHPHYNYFTVTLFLLLALFCHLNRSSLHGRSTLTLSLSSEALCQTKQNCEIILLMNKINQSTSYNKRFGSIIMIMIASHAPGAPSWWHNGSTRLADSPWLIMMMMIDCLKCLDCVHQ